MSAELVLKAVADSTRIKILSSLIEGPKFVEQLALELNINVSTASFHLKKLQAVGFVVAKKEQYYQTYSLNPNALKLSLLDIVEENRKIASDAFEQETLSECFKNGKLQYFPIQIKKREVIVKQIAKSFKFGKNYTEREVNLAIADFYDDFVVIRNEMVKFGIIKKLTSGQYLLCEKQKTLKKKHSLEIKQT